MNSRQLRRRLNGSALLKRVPQTRAHYRVTVGVAEVTRRRPGRLLVSTVAVLLATFSTVGGGAGSTGSSPDWDPKPQLTLDLRAVGYTPRVVKSTLTDREFLRRFNPGVDPSIFEQYEPNYLFVDEKTVGVYFVRGVYADPKDEQNDQNMPQGVILHVFLLDGTTGALIAKREFPTVFRRWFNGGYDTQSFVLPFGGGRFLVHANNRLMLFSGTFQLLQERDLPVDTKMNTSGGFIVVPGGAAKSWSEMWAVHVAIGGRSLLLQHTIGDRYFLEWLNPDDLTTVSTREAPTALMSVSDKLVTYRWYRSIQVLPREGGPRQVCSPSLSCEGGVPWQFLEREQLLVPRQRSFFVYSLAGDILWSRKGRFKGNGIPVVTSSLEGNRFVVPVSADRGGSFGETKLKRGENFLVYDARQRELIFQAHLAKGSGSPGLSPNGSTLALLAGTQIAFYSLPETD